MLIYYFKRRRMGDAKKAELQFKSGMRVCACKREQMEINTIWLLMQRHKRNRVHLTISLSCANDIDATTAKEIAYEKNRTHLKS